jgi:hypothetical protein
MAARRQVTNKLRNEYRTASKPDKSVILERVIATTGMGRSTARRMLAGPALPDPKGQIDGRALAPRRFSDDARALLEHVWALMGMPCGKYLVVMLGTWLPLMAEAGDLDKPFATVSTRAELEAMSAATVDRYLVPARKRMQLMGVSTTKPSPLLRNSISIPTCADEAPDAPGVIEADTVAHCGPTLVGEFARTLTMTDMVIGWTENCSIRNNASKWIIEGIGELAEKFPFPLVVFDSDCGGEFINHEVAAWLHARDIAQTRSRPYQKNDQATVESKNNHVVRKHAFYWRYDTVDELELLNQLWQLVSLRLYFFTPTKKPTGYSTTADGRRRRVYDKPKTPWQRLGESAVIDAHQLAAVAARIQGVNPAQLTRQINAIQMRLPLTLQVGQGPERRDGIPEYPSPLERAFPRAGGSACEACPQGQFTRSCGRQVPLRSRRCPPRMRRSGPLHRRRDDGRRTAGSTREPSQRTSSRPVRLWCRRGRRRG